MIKVIEAGLLTTLQDLGRVSGRPYGVPPGGAVDRVAAQAANVLVGNLPGAAVLEITLQGPRLMFEQNALIAVTGPGLQPVINGLTMPTWTSLFVRGGYELEFAPLASGLRSYLAVHGGFLAPEVLGSRSTYQAGGFGGYQGLGRALQAGDELAISTPTLRYLAGSAGRSWPEENIPAYEPSVTVRVIPGPFVECFTAEAVARFYQSRYTVKPQSNRMGLRLDGHKLDYIRPGLEIAACGTVFGTIQVPPDGLPIVLMADHQVTGGYPIIGTVDSADLPLLAQLRPGDSVTFKSHALEVG